MASFIDDGCKGSRMFSLSFHHRHGPSKVGEFIPAQTHLGHRLRQAGGGGLLQQAALRGRRGFPGGGGRQVAADQPDRRHEVCSGHDFCTAFAHITCTAPISRDHVFANPEWDGHRLDFCREWGTNCGRPAADAFCQAFGFPGALHATADQDPGYSSTRVIGSGQVCDQPFCRGFQQIICR